MSVNVSPLGPCPQLELGSGLPALGNKLFFYIAGTTTKQDTFTDSTGAVANANPLVLNSLGQPATEIWWTVGQSYKVVYAPSTDTDPPSSPIRTWDNLSTWDPAVNSTGLAASGGAALVGWIQAGIGAILRTLQAKGRERVAAADFSGYDPTGAADSAAAIASAFTLLGSAGGTVYINNGDKVLIDSNLTIPANCHLVGPHVFTGTPGSNASAPYGNVGGCIRLNSAASITLSSGASISGVYIIRKGMTFPADDSSAYAGNVIVAGGDDTALRNCLIIGFKKAYTVSARARFSLERVYFDCDPSAGDSVIEVSLIHDSGQISYCHGWPFGTIEAYSTATSGGTVNLAANAYRLHRAGNGIKISGQADDITLHGNLVYGYKKGFHILNTGGFQFTGSNWGDGTTFYAGSIGFSFENCLDISADQLRSYSCEKGFVFTLGSENKFTANMLFAAGCGSDGVTLDSGDFAIGTILAKLCGGAALKINATTVRMRLENLFDSGNTYANPIHLAVAGSRYEDVDVGGVISDAALGAALVGANDTLLYQLTSADPINLPQRPDIFYVLGTTNLGTINGLNGGREITLIFQDVLTVVNGVGNLRIGSNFTTNAGSVLKLVSNPFNGWLNQSSRNQN